MNNKAFTLVELIVVITILAVLATIWFISFQWYSVNSRDSVRLSDMANIEKWLSIKVAKAEKLPIPDDKIDITASGIILNYQWYAGQQTLWKIEVHGWWVDPLDQSYYTYSTNLARNQYQILGFFENEENLSFIHNTYADLSERFPRMKWDELWIILDINTQNPSQNISIDIDVVNTMNEYNLYIANEIEVVTWTWSEVFSKLYNNRIDLFQNKNFSQYDTSLIGYWDMETLYSSWWINHIKDLAWNNNHWKCYNYNTHVDCWSNQWAQLSNAVEWKGLFFDWIDDYFEVSELFNEKFPSIWTLNFFIDSKLSQQNQKSIFDNYNSTRNHMFF